MCTHMHTYMHIHVLTQLLYPCCNSPLLREKRTTCITWMNVRGCLTSMTSSTVHACPLLVSQPHNPSPTGITWCVEHSIMSLTSSALFTIVLHVLCISFSTLVCAVCFSVLTKRSFLASFFCKVVYLFTAIFLLSFGSSFSQQFWGSFIHHHWQSCTSNDDMLYIV